MKRGESIDELIAAAYPRVSTKEQKEKGNSLERQIERILDCAAEHGYHVPDEYIFPEVTSGEYEDRPKLIKVLRLCEQGKVDAVIVDQWDRLARDTDLLGWFKTEIQRHHGIKILCASESDPEDQSIGAMASRGVMGVVAQIENRMRRDRSVQAKLGKARAGMVVGSCPPDFGYEYVCEDRGSRRVRVYLQINEQEAKIVILIYEWYVYDSLCISEITRRLTEARIPTAADDPGRKIRKKAPAGVWNRASVRRILSNPVYDGRWHYKKIEVKVPRIVSSEVWEAAQERLQGNRDRYGATSKYDYLLTGMIYCKTCGRYRIGTSSTPGGRLYRYYVCPSKGCDSQAIPADKAEHYAWLLVLHFLRRPTVIHRWLMRRKESIEDANRPLLDQLELLNQREQELSQEAKRWEILFVKGRKSETELDKETEKIGREKAEIQKRKEHLSQALMNPVPQDYINSLVDYLRKAREMLGVNEWPDARDDWPETSDPDCLHFAQVENGAVLPNLDGTFPDLPDHVRHRLESLTFEEKRTLLESIGLSIFTDDDGTFAAFSIYPEQGFRVVDKSSTTSSSQNT